MIDNKRKIIARLPEDYRRTLLAGFKEQNVQIEHSYSRDLDDANVLRGVVLGVAFTSWGGTSDPLIVREFDGDLFAVSAAHVLRVRSYDPETGEAGAVLAGPDKAGVAHA